MQTILEIFSLLHSSIDSGLMTQEAIAVSALGLTYHIQAGWRDGAIPAEQVRQFSQEIQDLGLHWKAYCEERDRLCLPSEAGTPAPSIGPSLACEPVVLEQARQPVMLTADMKRAGAAVIKEGAGLDFEELASRIFLAMLPRQRLSPT